MQQQVADSLSSGLGGMPDVQRLARSIVSGNPSIEGVVLFGSRARDTARDDSDWDVALLAPEGCGKDVVRKAPRVPDVNYVYLSPKRLRERSHLLGTLEMSVVRDGILLAGNWSITKSRKRQRVSNANLYRSLKSAAEVAELATHRLLRVLGIPNVSSDNLLCAQTQNAAEYLSKAALLHLAVHPEFTHNVIVLADALRQKWPKHAWVDIIESLNGESSYRHTAVYNPSSVESINESVERLRKVVDFCAVVIRDISRQRPGFSNQLESLCKEVTDSVADSQMHSNWHLIPSDLKRALQEWNELATGTLENSNTQTSWGGFSHRNVIRTSSSSKTE